MLEIMDKIPISIWSVVLGSVIAFGGVLIQNASQNKRLKIQLDHDAKLKGIERKVAMRREVYLSAAEELVRANTYLGSLSQLDPTKINISDGLQNFFVAAAKLGLVAEKETGKALNELMLAYSGLVFKLLQTIAPINDNKSKISIITEHYNYTQTEIKRIISEMVHQNESGTPDERIFGVLSSSFERQQQRAKELSEERSECWDNVVQSNKKFALLLMEEMKKLTILQAPVLIGIRKELELEADIEDYISQINITTERVTKQLDDLLAAMGQTPEKGNGAAP